ncbi:MAG: ATP-binding protein, partial [Planctomycetaceae bacterium]|nr:ATP-binding protein [Planctomycetaceae bacterium]
YANEFEQLFGDLYIGQNPTPLKNSYAVMEFDFSSIDTASVERFQNSFFENVKFSVRQFLQRHKNIFPEAKQLIEQFDKEKTTLSILDTAFSVADEAGIKIFVIIDEYDHFANDLIAMGSVLGDDFYKKMVTANGLVRDFYEKLKIMAKYGIVAQTFITGISPVLLDDLTSGYNIVTNLSLDLQYNEMLGFTQEEVNKLRTAVEIDENQIGIDMVRYYNGYLFNEEGKNKVYNPSMILYVFDQLLRTGKSPKNLIDPNLSIDPKRLKRLVKNENNRNILIQIIKDGNIVSNVLEKFSIDRLNDDSYFISLLFYMGLLTIKEACVNRLRLVIPNYSIQRVYWEQIRQLIEESSQLVQINADQVEEAVNVIAFEGNIREFIDYVSQHVFSKLSDYDLQHFDEKYIKIMLLSYLLLNDIYIPMSEFEVVPGRADIFLQRNPKFPQVKYEWVWELKYCKTDAKETEIAQKRKEGLEQLNQYLHSARLKDRPNLKSALLIFIGKDKYEIVENTN